jgi:hypothetical protein
MDRPLKSETIFTDPTGQYCGAYGNVVILLTLGAPDENLVTRWVDAVSKYGRELEQDLGLLVVIAGDARVPSDAERTTISHAFAGVATVVRGAVEVVEGRGFIAAAMRGALTVINLTKSLGYPIKVASNFAEATTHLRRLLGTAFDSRIDAASLSRATETLRAAAAQAGNDAAHA